MFRCKGCIEKDKHIEFLEKQNKDLYDRLMAFNKDAFLHYKAETKSGGSLFPHGVDEKGKPISYKDTNPAETNQEIFRAMGEDSFSVEEPEKELARK